jgi:hypothetical protein
MTTVPRPSVAAIRGSITAGKIMPSRPYSSFATSRHMTAKIPSEISCETI